ncbi:MAG: hypothetical protein R2762_15920 [Bryobacteraceae bacterium]
MRVSLAALAAVLGLSCLAATAGAATFGRVVAIGGHASDLALDEARNVLYVANFTANRIEIVSLSDGSIQTSMNLSAQPNSLALSPDNRYLLVGHYGNFAAPNSPNNALTLIDLNTRARQTFALGFPVLGVAFGIDGRALVMTTADFELFEPVSGATRVLTTIADAQIQALPAKPNTAPPAITTAALSTSADGRWVYGLTDQFTFRYDVEARRINVRGYTSEPTMGPRAVSVSSDGSSYIAGWVLHNRNGDNISQFADVLGTLDVGSHAYDSSRGVIYSQLPTSTGGAVDTQAPVLQVLDAKNLAVRERLQLAEPLSGRSVINSDNSVVYSISASGVTIFPVGALDDAPRIAATTEDLIFRGNFCDRRVSGQEFAVVSSNGAPVDFSISTATAGIRLTPSSGVTPATVRVTVDPNAFQNLKGTVTASISIRSNGSISVPKPVRVLINNREPDQRGTVVNVPGQIVDMLSDPTRDRFYLLRKDTNEVLVYGGNSYSLQARLKTANGPTQMAVTFDQRYLLVGHDLAQIMSVYDLETLEELAPVIMPGGHYPRSIAASGKAILAANRVAGPVNKIDRVDLISRTAVELPTLGVYENDIDQSTALVASANGSRIMAVQANGNALLYDANADTFTISRKVAVGGEKLSGAYAASSYDRFVVGNRLLNASLVPVATFDGGTAQSAGFAFVETQGLRSTAVSSASPGVIERIDAEAGQRIRPTRMVEAPYLGTADFPFTRTLAPLYSRNVIANLTTSGFTVLPWNYDAAVAAPRIDRITNAADGGSALATGGLISVYGENLSPVNVVSKELPLPTALGESCLTVNGVPSPVLFVSPSQINAQIPYNVDGSVTMILRTPGGVSDNFNLTVRPSAPSVFRSPQDAAVATVVRQKNGEVATLSNPIHRGDQITIYLTGLGRTSPAIDAGVPAPSDPPLQVLNEPLVTLGGQQLAVSFAGLSPGQVGVYQINATVPGAVPLGLDQPLLIQQATGSTEISVRVVD